MQRDGGFSDGIIARPGALSSIRSKKACWSCRASLRADRHLRVQRLTDSSIFFKTEQLLLFVALENQNAVVSTETEGVAHGCAHRSGYTLVGYIIEVALRIRIFIVACRRIELLLE